jgi:AraC-like DNA-binding protein
MNITEIASALQYSSVGHLSNQFKKVTGMTPSDFKKTNHIDSLDESPPDSPKRYLR